jgi:hypothetical protein
MDLDVTVSEELVPSIEELDQWLYLMAITFRANYSPLSWWC